MITPTTLVAPTSWAFPVEGRHVLTSPFGMRTSPTSGRRVLHAGQDLAVPPGTLVVAAADGIVRVSTTDSATGCRGEYIILDHGGGWDTRYFHLSRRDVRTGDRVVAGQPLGLSGRTGCVTGPHLHFEAWRDGEPTNPAAILKGIPALGRVFVDVEEADEDMDEDRERRRLAIPIRIEITPEAAATVREVTAEVKSLGTVIAFLGIGAAVAGTAALAYTFSHR